MGMEEVRLSWEILGGRCGEELATVWTEKEEESRISPSFQTYFGHAEFEMPVRPRGWSDGLAFGKGS